MKIILGSSSPHRKRILHDLGYDFEVRSPDIDEKAIRDNDPEKLVLKIARAKADAVKRLVHSDAIIITSDSVAWVNKEIREKPKDEEEAKKFLHEIAQSVPQTIYTSVVVINTRTGKQYEGVDAATVIFKEIPKTIQQQFLDSGEAYYLAGGFAVENEPFSRYIAHIDGEIETITGLPKALTRELIKKARSGQKHLH